MLEGDLLKINIRHNSSLGNASNIIYILSHKEFFIYTFMAMSRIQHSLIKENDFCDIMEQFIITLTRGIDSQIALNV